MPPVYGDDRMNEPVLAGIICAVLWVAANSIGWWAVSLERGGTPWSGHLPWNWRAMVWPDLYINWYDQWTYETWRWKADTHVIGDLVQSLCDRLGVRPKNVCRIVVEPDRVILTMYDRDSRGRIYIPEGERTPVTFDVTFPASTSFRGDDV